MIRAFIALEIPAAILRRLGDVASELNRLGLAGRRSRLEGIHLTLRFLGNIEPGQVKLIDSRLSEIAAATEPFELQIAGVGVFPDLARPRVVWAGIRPSPPLQRLHQEVEAALEELSFAAEDRSFRPHLTLFRLKSPRNRDNLVRYVSRRAEPPRFGDFEAREFHLFQSVLKPGGAEYAKLVSWKLGNS